MELATLKIGDIHPYERNARKNDNAVDAVAESIRQCEYIAPIIVDENHVILCGHTRLKALKKLGRTEAECVVKAGLTDEQKRKYRLLDNKTAEIADWDFDLLDDELEGLDFDGFDFGFDLPDEDETEIVEDEAPEVNETKEPKAKLGDIYQLGRHRLMCGDSTKAEDVEKLLCGEECDTYVIDPPFEVHELYKSAYIQDLENKKVLVMYDHKHFGYAIKAFMDNGCIPQYEFIWDCVQSWYTPNRPLARHKTCAVFSKLPDWNFEAAIIDDGKRRNEGTVTNTRGTYHYKPLEIGVHMRTVESFSNANIHDYQGHGKPVDWLKAILSGISAVKCCDLFGGSGAVLMACENMGIPCFEMEIEPVNVDAIIKRWENETGNISTLIT